MKGTSHLSLKKQTGLVKVITLNPRLPVSDFLCGSGGWKLNVLQHLLCIRASLQPMRGRRSNDKEVCFGPRSRGLPAAGEGREDRGKQDPFQRPKRQSPSESNEQTDRTPQSTRYSPVRLKTGKCFWEGKKPILLQSNPMTFNVSLNI